MTAFTHIPFEDIDWKQVGPGVREKRNESKDGIVRLVEFAAGFVEPDWCTKQHVGYVIEGCLELRFESDAVELRRGQAIVIPGGGGGRHRARVLSDQPATLLLVESAAPARP